MTYNLLIGMLKLSFLLTLGYSMPLCASKAAAQCTVIGPVCLFMDVCVCLFVGLLPQ